MEEGVVASAGEEEEEPGDAAARLENERSVRPIPRGRQLILSLSLYSTIGVLDVMQTRNLLYIFQYHTGRVSHLHIVLFCQIAGLGRG